MRSSESRPSRAQFQPVRSDEVPVAQSFPDHSSRRHTERVNGVELVDVVVPLDLSNLSVQGKRLGNYVLPPIVWPCHGRCPIDRWRGSGCRRVAFARPPRSGRLD